MLIFCSLDISYSMYFSGLANPSSRLMRLAKDRLSSGMVLSRSTSFFRLRWARSYLPPNFCRVSSLMQGRLTSSQQVLALVSPNSLKSTQRLDQSRQAQPRDWYSSSRKWAVLRQHLIIDQGVRHSSHSYLRKRRSPESMRDMMVSSAWKPQLMPKESLDIREASLSVSDLMPSRYRSWFSLALKQMQVQAPPRKMEVVRVRSLRLRSAFPSIIYYRSQG